MHGLAQHNNFWMKNGLPLEAKRLNNTAAWSSVAQVLANIPLSDRALGDTVMIGNTEYWWRYGITDADLVEKTGGGGGTGDAVARTIAQLRTETSESTEHRYMITDRGKEGEFFYDPTDTTSPDNGGTVIVSGTRRYKRIFYGPAQASWFGAKGDGVFDNFTILSNLLTDVTIPWIEFSHGIFLTTQTLTINRSNLRITGLGKLKKSGTGTDALLVLDNVSNVWIKDIFLEGTGLEAPYNPATLKGHTVVLSQKCENILLENLTIENSGRDGVYINELGTFVSGNHGRNIRIKRCSFNNISRNGVSVISGENIQIDECTFRNYQLCGVDVEPNTENTIIKDIFVDKNYLFGDAATGAAIQARVDYISSIYTRVFFRNNIVFATQGVNKSEIRIVNVQSSAIEDNTIYNPSGGITVDSNRVRVRRNKMLGPNTATTTTINTAVMYIIGHSNLVAHNEVDGTTGNGLYVANSDNIVVCYNVIKNVNKKSVDGVGYGMLIRGGLSGVVVSNTIVQDETFDIHAPTPMDAAIRLENGAVDPEGWLISRNNIQGAVLDVDTPYMAINNIYDNGQSSLLTPGSIPFIGIDGKPTDSNADLFYNPTLKRLGLGTTDPNGRLTIKTTIPFSPVNTVEWTSLLIDNTGLTAGEGNFGSGIGFSSLGASATAARKKAAIVAVQSGPDPDQIGISFFIHPDTTATTDLQEALRVDQQGIKAVRGSFVPKSYTVAERDAIASGEKPVGMLIRNVDTNILEWWNGAAWTPAGGGSGGTSYTAGPGITISPENVISATGSTGSNPMGARSILDHGGAADGSTSGTNFTGTNNSIAMAAAITANTNGQTIIVPHGTYTWLTPVALPTNKRCVIVIYGNIQAPNGVFTHTGTQFHDVRIYGEVTGKLGITTHSRDAFLAGTGMNDYSASINWDTLVGSCFEFTDVYRGYYFVNYVTGYKAAIHFKGGTTANEGGQEMTIQFQYLNRNKYGIWLQSMDGSSYIDKITFSGPNGGTARVGGHQAIFIDGGTTETGAARSNNFVNILTEFCNFGIKITGDATYNKFIGHRWEGGSTTGHFANSSSDPDIKARAFINISKTTVSGGVLPLGTQFIACSHMYVDWWTYMGRQAVVIGTPIWNRNAQVMFASTAVGRDDGRMVVTAQQGLSTFSRTQLPTYVDYLAFGTATPNSATDSMIFRNSATGVEYIQKYSGGGGGGGTSQWEDVTNGIQYLNNVGVGIAPLAATALALFVGTTSKAPLNLRGGGIKPTPVYGDVESDGTDLYWTQSNNQRRKLPRYTDGQPFLRATLGDANTTYTPTIDIGTIICEKNAAGALSITLPPAADHSGREIVIRQRGATAVNVTGGDPWGTNSLTGGTQAAMVYRSDGTNWIIKSKSTV